MPLPLTLPQQNIWHLQQAFGPAAAAITMSAMFSESVSEPELREALLKTYGQTDVLRLAVGTEEGEPVQTFLPPGEPDAPVMEFRSLSALRKWTERLAQTGVSGQAGGSGSGFSPASSLLNPASCLWRAYILKAGGRTGLALHCHHFMADAWGMYVLAKRVRANLLGEEVRSGAYADFIDSDLEYLHSQKRTKAFAYFEREFALCPRPVYLADKLRPSLEAKRLSLALSGELSLKIDESAARTETTSYALFLCALGKAIADLRGAERLFLGTTVLNRMGRRELDTVGMFVNTVPVLMDFSGGLTPAETVSAQTGRLMGIFRHQRCGYTRLLADLREKYELRGGLYDVMLNFQNVRMDSGEMGADVNWHFSGVQGETLQLHIHDWAGEGIYHIDYDYRTALLGAGDVKRLHRAVEENLRTVCG